MPHPDLYYQCKLERGPERTTGWLEARGAAVGKRVQLLELSRPGELWTVVTVASAPLSKAQLAQKQQNDRNALPSIIGMTR